DAVLSAYDPKRTCLAIGRYRKSKSSRYSATASASSSIRFLPHRFSANFAETSSKVSQSLSEVLATSTRSFSNPANLARKAEGSSRLEWSRGLWTALDERVRRPLTRAKISQ